MHSTFTIREKILLGTIAGYLLLNQGFVQLRIPPVGKGVPIGELVLVFAFVSLNVFKIAGRLNRVLWLLPLLLWWIYGICRSLLGMPEYGMWALRDASQVIDSLFLVLGFTLALNPAKLDRLFHFFCGIMFVGAVYGLSFPAGKFLVNYSPHIMAAGGYSIPIFFSYINSGTLEITAAVMLMLVKTPYAKGSVRYAWIALFLGAAIGLGQSRTVYAQVILVLFLFLLFQRKTFVKWSAGIAVALLLILLVSASGTGMRGRLGKVSLDFASKHFQSVSGSSEDQALSGSAGGIALRLGWWKKIGRELSQTPENLMFGLGYGMPLVNYTLGGGVVVREPHNSFISVLARLGVLGAFCWISMQFTLFWTWWSGFRLARRRGWTVDAMRLLVMMIFCSIILVGIVGEDMLEKPFNAAPYYFIWGVIIAYVSHVRVMAARGPARDKGQAPPAAQFEQIGAGRGILT
jgi:O-antigen ligase